MVQSSHRFLLVRHQIFCLNPVLLGGQRSAGSLSLSRPPIGLGALTLTVHRPNSVAGQSCWLYWIVKCMGNHHHYDTSTSWLIELLTRTCLIDVSLIFLFNLIFSRCIYGGSIKRTSVTIYIMWILREFQVMANNHIASVTLFDDSCEETLSHPW